jgi:hypothetical protein
MRGETSSRRNIARFVQTAWGRAFGRASDVRPCPHGLRVPPKFSIAFVIGFLKDKSTVRIHRSAGNKPVTGLHFWYAGIA